MAKETFAVWMNAKYDGRCRECEGDISAGDRIVYADHRTYCGDCGEEIAGVDPAPGRVH